MEILKYIIEGLIVVGGCIYGVLVVLMPISICCIEMKLNEIEERLKK